MSLFYSWTIDSASEDERATSHWVISSFSYSCTIKNKYKHYFDLGMIYWI